MSGPISKRESVPLRVLHLISSAGFLGAENVVLELATQFREAGLHVSIVVLVAERNPNGDLAEAARKREIPVSVFPCAGRLDARVIGTIREMIRRERVDVLHSHNYKSNFYAWRALRGTTCAWVITNHGRRSGFRLLLYNLADAYVTRHADSVIAVSDRIARTLRVSGVPADKIRVIDNGIDTERFAKQRPSQGVRCSLRVPAHEFVIGTIGALTKEKGHTFLLRAAPAVLERFPSVKFLIVGDGPKLPALQEEASRLGISQCIVFAGRRADIPEVLGLMDIFILPSLREGLPMALLEAQAARVPVIASGVGAIPKVIQNGISGTIVPPGDPNRMADAIKRVLSDYCTYIKMADYGRRRVEEYFSSRSMAGKYVNIYRKLMAAPE